MVRHVVLWKLKPEGISAFELIKSTLVSQKQKIPVFGVNKQFPSNLKNLKLRDSFASEQIWQFGNGNSECTGLGVTAAAK